MKRYRIYLFIVMAMIFTMGLSWKSSISKIFTSEALAQTGEIIRCPVSEVRTEITTPLPQPWWNTPYIGRLRATRVQTIGGSRTLVCEYDAGGRLVSVMREFPAGVSNCAPRGPGFFCR